jgi:hypothetical protein
MPDAPPHRPNMPLPASLAAIAGPGFSRRLAEGTGRPRRSASGVDGSVIPD